MDFLEHRKKKKVSMPEGRAAGKVLCKGSYRKHKDHGERRISARYPPWKKIPDNSKSQEKSGSFIL